MSTAATLSAQIQHDSLVRSYTKTIINVYIYLIYHIVSVNTTYSFEFIATCFDFNQSSFRRAYEP